MAEKVKIGQLYRYKGDDAFFAGIWKVIEIQGPDELVMSDMYGGAIIKTHNRSFLNYFEIFTPPEDKPVIRWKTKYLGVVDE